MKFSILVPMYNVEKFLSKSIDSVLAQTYKNFELILVNDGSKDGSLEIAKEYEKNDKRIIVINQENKGLVQARRAAIKEASGEYIVILDSDDLLEEYTLIKLYESISSSKSDLVLFKHRNIDDENNFRINRKHPLEDDVKLVNNALELFLFENKLVNMWSKCFKAELLKNDFIDYNKIGHLNMSEDRLQSVFAFYNAKNITFLNEDLYRYRLNPNSITQNITIKNLNDSLKVYDTIYEYYSSLLAKNMMDRIVVHDAISIVGKYLRWYSTNDINKEENEKMLDYLINTDVLKRSKGKAIKFKDRIILHIFVNKNMFLISILNELNKKRIKNQLK